MEIMVQLEKACRDSDHESIKQELDSIESYELKKEAFQKIIDYYENEKGRFPVGYCLLFIEWLLKNRELDTAGDYIARLDCFGVAGERVSGLIFEYVIKPEEPYYRERFERNLEILKRNRVLISEQEFNFEDAIQNITTIRYDQTGLNADTNTGKNSSLMAIDIINFEVLKEILEKKDLVYLVYDDLKKFYYVLLFEDLRVIIQNIETEKVLVFPGRDMEHLKRFFDNMMVVNPEHILDMSDGDVYDNFKTEINNEKLERIESYIYEMNAYYKDKDFNYYKELFNRDPSDIKILLITSEYTDLNKFIARTWYEAFVKMGYSARILIETKPYEMMQQEYIIEQTYEFKPDMVFHINYAVDDYFDENHIRENLLWIMRYRDKRYGDTYGSNMFFLPLHNVFAEDLKEIKIKENRIFSTPEGVNINLFRKKGEINNIYACDITYVSNSGGAGNVRLDYYLEQVKNQRAEKIFRDIYNELKEMLNDNHICSPVDTNNIVCNKLRSLGISMPDIGKKFITTFVAFIMESLYRDRITEWIIDSGITRNIKLWGKHWSNVDKFRKFHMGIAKYGEELASIYENSKISITDVPWLHERNLEIIASGGFPLVRYYNHPTIDAQQKITNFFKENEEVVFYYSKDDLLNKIQYYLDNPEERERIAENGRQVVSCNFTHMAIAKKSMDFIKNYYRD
jgi:spore maturation protein CgeB